MGRKERKKGATGSHHDDTSTHNKSRAKFQKDKGEAADASIVRKVVDPETAAYFTEIANVIGGEMELEERASVCDNALEEARGKEVELATDYYISHIMQNLLEGCSLDRLCNFLRSCATSFSHIATDKSGSHVAETALKSLATHLQDDEAHSLIDQTLNILCQAIVVDPVNIVCNCYGSHVLRRLICLCKGDFMDSEEFRGKKPSTLLAERLNLGSSQLVVNTAQENQPFPDQLQHLISEMLNPSRVNVAALTGNQFGSLVLQTALKSLIGQEQELLRTIPILLGCSREGASEGNTIEVPSVKRIMRQLEDNAFSHLMEVILMVAPDSLYDELFRKVFKDSLFKMSSNPCANFVVQALVSYARTQEHIKLIWEELGTKFKDLLEMGVFGVVAVLLAASYRLQTYEREFCESLAEAVGLTKESSAPVVPRILYIDNYIYSNNKANWEWPNGTRMHVLGSLILQSIFRFPSEHIQAYITSIIYLEDIQVLEACKDPSGARVIEAFLNSSASAKQKRKLVSRLRGHFGELSLTSSGAFTVEKCFNVSNLSLREAVVSELLPVQAELSKTRQGPYLLKKLDVESFARRPDQWRSRQNSKESAYTDFYSTFGPEGGKSSRSESFLADNYQKSSRGGSFLADNYQKQQPESMRGMREEIETRLFPGKSGAPFLAHQGSRKPKKSGSKQAPGSMGGQDSNRKRKRHEKGNTGH